MFDVPAYLFLRNPLNNLDIIAFTQVGTMFSCHQYQMCAGHGAKVAIT